MRLAAILAALTAASTPTTPTPVASTTRAPQQQTADIGDGREYACSLAFWIEHPDAWIATGYRSDDEAATVFDVMGSATLLDVLRHRWTRDGRTELLRHATVALLNAAHPAIDYGTTESMVVDVTNTVLTAGAATQFMMADRFDDHNAFGCPLGG